MEHKYSLGRNLIFLISQPRSGSTMTQRILGSHTLIHTQSEPWVLLHPMHALRDDNIVVGYDSALYVKALNDFIDQIPGKEAKYLDKISNAYLDFYQLILSKNDKQFFLDKTPRYYFIIDELLQYFPKSRIIFLWRNPAAVLSSIIKSWTKNEWYKLADYKHDLMLAPTLMINAQTKYKNQILTLRYEDLVTNPNDQIGNLCKFLGISFEKEMLNYGNLLKEKWRYGDQGTVYQKIQPDSSYAENWHKNIDNPQTWRVIYDYVKFLGKATFNDMGYVYDEVMDALQKCKPYTNIEADTVALEALLDNVRDTFIEKNRTQALLSQAYASIKQKSNELIQLKESLKRQIDTNHQKDGLLEYKDGTISEQQAFLKKQEIELNAIKDREIYLKKTIAEKEKTLHEQQAVIEKREIELKAANDRETNLKKTIAEKEKIVQEQRAVIEKRETELKSAHDRETVLKKTIAEKEKTMQEQRAVIAKREIQLKAVNDREINLKNIIAEKEKTIQEQRTVIEKRETELKALKDRETNLKSIIDENRRKIVEQQALISKRDAELMSVKKEETELRNTIAKKEVIVAQQLDTIRDREKDLQNLNQQLTKAIEVESLHKNDLIKKNTTINQLEAKLQESAKSVSQLEEVINQQQNLIKDKDELFELVVKSYSFRLGSFLLKPAKIIKQLKTR